MLSRNVLILSSNFWELKPTREANCGANVFALNKFLLV